MITIEEFKKKHSKKVRFIGLDLGSKRIWVSICDEKQSIATPFKTINKTNTNSLIDDLKKIIKENNIEGIIIGNPVNMDGSLGRSAQSVNDVATNISKSIELPTILWDERLSTVGAFNISSQLDVNVSKRVKTIDQNAAAFILQGAIDFLKNLIIFPYLIILDLIPNNILRFYKNQHFHIDDYLSMKARAQL